MGCQRDVAAKIIEQGGDYILALKGNQESLYEQARCYLDEALELARTLGNYHEQESKGHGRHEIRRCWVMDEVEELAGRRGEMAGVTQRGGRGA